MSSAGTNEPHRLRKMRDGKNGFTCMNALDESVDNAIDEGAKNITMDFKYKKVLKIHNDGNPMTPRDREASLCLDSDNKSLNHKKKGQFGIGFAAERAMLAGQGIQTITTVDEDGNCYQVNIYFDELCKSDNKQCWSSTNPLQPVWKPFDNSNGIYQFGVTKEYLGDHLKQHFGLQDVYINIAKKYNKEIKGGLKFIIKWDDTEYIVSDHFNGEGDIERVKHLVIQYNDGSMHIPTIKKIGEKTKPDNVVESDIKNEIQTKHLSRTKDEWGDQKDVFIIDISMPKLLETDTDKNDYRNGTDSLPRLFQHINYNNDGADKYVELVCQNDEVIKIKMAKDEKNEDMENCTDVLRQLIDELSVEHVDGYSLGYNTNYRKDDNWGTVPEGNRFHPIMNIRLTIPRNYNATHENKSIVKIDAKISKAIHLALSYESKKKCNHLDKRGGEKPPSKAKQKAKEDAKQIASLKEQLQLQEAQLKEAQLKEAQLTHTPIETTRDVAVLDPEQEQNDEVPTQPSVNNDEMVASGAGAGEDREPKAEPTAASGGAKTNITKVKEHFKGTVNREDCLKIVNHYLEYKESNPFSIKTTIEDMMNEICWDQNNN
jgi:hypothetical protein